jgi:formate dehydrogenase major subunit
VAPDGSDELLLYTKQFKSADGKATFYPVPWTEPSDQPDTDYDLHLNNGRLLEHFHEGNLTYRSEGIREKTPCTVVEVSPELARERGIRSGALVELDSRYGKVAVQVVVTPRVSGKELYMPMNSVEEPVNRLTSSYTDKATHTPAYKEASVRTTVLKPDGADPLPRANWRYGNPTPQMGVEVERKWARADYREPGHNLVQISNAAPAARGQER